MKIYQLKNSPATEADRLSLAVGLIKMGYTVRIGADKAGENSIIYKYFIEFTEGGFE